MENSDQTNQAIDALRNDDGESEVDRYQHKTWKYIERFMNDETMHGFDQKDRVLVARRGMSRRHRVLACRAASRPDRAARCWVCSLDYC